MNDSGPKNETAGARQSQPPKGWIQRFVGWFLQRLYTDWAWGYDLVASLTSMGQWWTWQRAVDDALPDGRLLELGFGTGRLMRRMSGQNREVIGVDLSAQMVEIATRRLVADDLPLRLARADALALPFPNRAFAGAYATFPSDFILEVETLSEVLRVLQAGGTFVIVPMARIRGQSVFDRFAGWLYRITGQSGPLADAWDAPFRQLNVDTRLELVDQPRAQVLRLIITKPESEIDRIPTQAADSRWPM